MCELVEMEKDSIKVSFQECIDSLFPVGGKRTRSAMIRKEVAQRIVNHLKGTSDADGAFRHFVKRSGFALVDLQSVGIRDVLVVSVKEKNQVLILSRRCLPLFFLAPPPPPVTSHSVSKLYSSYIEWQ